MRDLKAYWIWCQLCAGIVFLSAAALAQTVPAPASTPAAQTLARPTANGLERGEARRRSTAATMAGHRVTFDNAEIKRATAALAALPANAPAQKKTAAQTRLTRAQQTLTADQSAASTASKRVTDWDASTLSTHKADAGKYKLDWSKGQIVAR